MFGGLTSSHETFIILLLPLSSMHESEKQPVSDMLKYPLQTEHVSGMCQASSDMERQNHDYYHRCKHVGLRKPLHPDQQHRADLPGCSQPRCGGRPDPLHPGNCRAGLLHLRLHRGHDRGTHPQRLQVGAAGNRWGAGAPNLSRILLLALVCSALLFPLVSATYVSFNPVGLDPDNLHVYNGSGVLVGVYNTSTTAIYLDPNESYTFLVAPANDNLLGNHPETWFDNFVAKFQQNAIAYLLIGMFLALAGVAIARTRR